MKIINPLKYDDWDSLVLSSKDYSFFHSTAWARILHDSYNYKPMYFAHIENNEIKFLIPLMEVNSFITGRRGVSLPFSDYCEPTILSNTNQQQFVQFIFEQGEKVRWNYVELKGGAKIFELDDAVSFFYRHKLDLLQKKEEIFASFRKGTKSSIKKADRKGVNVNIYNTMESVEHFYNLQCVTRKKHGLPPQPIHFFKQVYNHAVSKNHGFVVLANYDDKIIAGSIFLHFGDQAVYKYGASLQEYNHLSANNLVLWKAIKWYSSNNFKNLCFGRTEHGNKGLRRFKSGWGTEEDKVYYFRYSLKNKSFIKGKENNGELIKKIFGHMPLPVLRLIGTALYKHIG